MVSTAAVLVLVVAVWTNGSIGISFRSTPVYDPPVLAGQMASSWCGGGVYGRVADKVVLTSSGHCAPEGQPLTDLADQSLVGVWGPISQSASCPYEGYRCTASDMNYLIVAGDRIPWGHLNEIDMGAGGYRTVSPDTRPLDCTEIGINDQVEIDGRGIYRTGRVLEKGEYLKPRDRDPVYFPCIIAANIRVGIGDSGGVVFVRGIPSGISSRSFGGVLGFTPLAAGLEELGVTMCDTPNCGLTPSSP